jgi:hypothetical protein
MNRKLLLLSPSRSSKPPHLAAFFCLLLALILTVACGEIAVRDNTPPAPAQNSAAGAVAPPGNTAKHDLSIMGVDFDPGLDIERIINRERVSMIVGVMNLGSSRENRVRVKASLWDAEGRLVLARAEDVVDSVAAGDVVAARLVTNDTPPVYSRYQLQVEIVPVTSELNVENNKRTLDILVRSAR